MKTTAREAFLAGETRFDTGRACRHGHTGPRYVSTGGCCACLTQFRQDKRQAWISEALGEVVLKVIVKKDEKEAAIAAFRALGYRMG